MPAVRPPFRFVCVLAALSGLSAASPPSPSLQDSPVIAADTAAVAEPAAPQYATTLARELAFGSTGMYLGLNALLAPWSSSIVLPTSEATTQQNGLCTFRAQYFVRNLGFLSSIPTQNTLRRNAPGGMLLSSVAMGALPYNTLFNASSDIVLAPGSHTLYAKIDEPNTNAEYYENNNLNRVLVTVQGSCN